MSHWAEDLIGHPAPDCWAFVRGVWLQRYGFDVPTLPYAPLDQRHTRRQLAEVEEHGWTRVAAPEEGYAVLMAQGLRPCHVGIWIAPDGLGGVLHWTETSATVFTVPGQLGSYGYHITGFWTHASLRGAAA
jgi:hypothetical protein